MPIIDARYYKTLVICPNKAMASELAPMLAYGLPLAPVHVASDYPARRSLAELLKKADPKLCFLDFSTNLEMALATAAELQALNSGLPVVALLPGNNPDLILRCLRQGAADFLIRPFTSDQIDSAVEKVARQIPPPSARVSSAKTVAVFPAKGACGATTVACNLAIQSKRLGAKRILLADLDPITGTVSFLLKLKSSYSFMDVLSRQGTLDGDLWKQMVTVYQGIDVLLSPENLMDGLDELADAGPILDYAQSMYETIIVDCGSSFTNWNLSTALLCDELVVVTTNELPALQSTQRALAWFEQHRIDQGKIRVVVNRYEREIGLNSDVISSVLQTDIYQVVPADYEAVQKSQMEGKPLPAGSVAAKGLAALADKIWVKKDKSQEKKSSSLTGGFKSLFSRTGS
ncbi:MAG: AAA family ATPase [Bryobacteraceae bacterium]